MLGDSLSQIRTENTIRESRDIALVWKPWVTLIVALLTGNRTACSVIGSSLLNTTETDWAKTLNQSGLILGIIQVLHKTFIKKLQTQGSTIVGCGQTRTGRTLRGLIWIWPFRAIHFSTGNTRFTITFNTIHWWFEIHIETFLRMYVSCILSAPAD